MEPQACNTQGCQRKRSPGVLDSLIELSPQVRKRREVRYRCNTTMTYGLLFYDIRNKEVKKSDENRNAYTLHIKIR